MGNAIAPVLRVDFLIETATIVSLVSDSDCLPLSVMTAANSIPRRFF